MLKTRLVPVVVLLMLLTSALPAVDFEVLEDAPEIKKTPANLETYNLYLGEEGESGGDGSIQLNLKATTRRQISSLV